MKPRVLAHSSGSGNWGEQGDSAFYTVDRLPDTLRSLSETNLAHPPSRRDIDLGAGGQAFVIDGILTPAEADALAAATESIFVFNNNSRVAPGIHTPPGMRQNMAAHWFPTDRDAEPLFFAPLYARFKHLLPPTVARQPLFDRMNQKFAVFKYEKEDQFRPHVDGVFPGSFVTADGTGVENYGGVDSGLSMLIYLNDDFEGGATRLYKMGTGPQDGEFVDVVPKKGSALFFRHGNGRDSVLHAGMPVTQGRKYLCKTNALYGVKTGRTTRAL